MCIDFYFSTQFVWVFFLNYWWDGRKSVFLNNFTTQSPEGIYVLIQQELELLHDALVLSAVFKNRKSPFKLQSSREKSTLACTLWWFCFVFLFSSFILSPPEEKRNCCLGKFWFLQYVVRENRASDHASMEDEEPGLEATLGVCVNAQEDREYLLQLLISSFCYDT